MSKICLDVEISPWIANNGVDVAIYVGDNHEPSVEQSFSFDYMINEHLDLFAFGGRISGKSNLEQAEEVVLALEEAAEYARNRFNELTK